MSTITLAGKTYELRPLPIRQARALRAKIKGPVEQFVAALGSAQSVQITDLQRIAGLAGAMQGVLLDGLDTALDVLFEYSPELAADRDLIESQATDEDAMKAFVEVLKLLYPFGGLMTLVNGLATQQTSTS